MQKPMQVGDGSFGKIMCIVVGKILKPQGIGGEVKASCTTDASLLGGIETLYVESTPHVVTKIRVDGAFFYVRFADVCDRNAAESLRGLRIFCEKGALTLPEGKFFVEDVIGCDVLFENGRCAGKVVDVLQYGSADVFVCRNSSSGEFSFPFLKDLLIKADTDKKQLVLDSRRFAEVVTDEFSEEVTDDEN